MNTLPRRRTDLVVTDLDGERVVFDAATNTAHKLTADAVAVWQRCDGTSSVEAAGAELSLTTAQVSAAAAELIDAGLADAPGFSRRRLLQGGAVVGAVFVSSVVLPAANAAASPIASGGGRGNPQTLTYNLFAERRTYNTTGPFFFYQGTTPGDVSSLTAASTPYLKVGEQSGTPARGFQGSDGGLPIFYTVTEGEYRDYTTVRTPNNTFALHPGQSTTAVIGFKNQTGAPATIHLNGQLLSRNTSGSGSGGVNFSIVDASGQAAPGETLPTGTTPGTLDNGDSFDVTFDGVAAGSFVYIVVDNKGDYTYDTTGVDLTVTVN